MAKKRASIVGVAAAAVLVAGLGGLAAAGGGDGPLPPPASRSATTRASSDGARSDDAPGTDEPAVGAPADGAGRRAATDEAAAPTLPPCPPGDALAPAHAAPALGLVVDAATTVDVDPLTGRATLRETDAALPGGLGLRRARAAGADAPGLFGRGWRSEADARLHAGPEGALIARRADGLVVYAPVGEGRWLSVVGEVEPLVATPAGYEGHDAAGRLLRFDHEGRVVEVRPGFRVERAPGLVRLVGDAATLTLTLDDQGRAARASGPGVELTYAYDARGELVAVEGTRAARYAVEDGFVVEARGLRLTHDEGGRLARLAGPDGERVYAFAEGLAQVTTPRGTWRYALEASGAPGHAGWRVDTPWGVERGRLDARLRLVVDEVPTAEVPPGVRLGPGGLVEAATTAAGRRWTFEHDARGDLVAEVGPAGRVELARDARGRRVGRRDEAGLEVTAICDARGLVEELVAADGAAVRLVHDAAGRLVSAGGDADPVGLAWDDAGRLVEQATPGVRLRYEHGPGLERVQTPWGPFARARDAEGRVERLDTPAGAFHFEHDAAGRRTAVVYPNGVVTRLERDAAGRVAALEARGPAGDVLSLAHARGARGEVTATTRDGATTRFGHDAAGRLTSARGRDLDRAWTLDADGNRLADRDGARARAWCLDAQGKALAAGDERLEHDRAGRLVRRVGPDGETRYGWDGFGRLVEVTRVDRAGAYTARYAYDGLGRVVTRTTDAGTTRYVYERGQRLAELGPGDRVRLWVHGPRTDEPLAYLDVEGGVVGEWVFLHADAQGTVLAYSDEDGALVDRAALDPFGDLLEAPLDPARPVLFAGREVDPATDLVDLRARFYAPGLGRFLDADPVGVCGGPAPWVYADHRPLERRDPLGLWPWRDADEEALGRAPRPSALERARARLTGWLLGASLDGARLLEATAEVLDAGQTALRDARLQLVRSGAVAPRGRSGPYGSESVAANFFRDTVAPLGLELLELAEAPLAMGRELVSLRGDAEGVARAFGEGYRDAALGYGKAFDAWQAKHERRAELLLDDGHSLESAAFNVIAAAGLEVIVPGVSAWEAGTGRDFSAFVDEGQVRRLSPLERGVRAVEVVADLASAGVGTRARAARAGEAVGDVVAASDRGARALPAPRAPAPRDGLVQTLDRDAARGAGPRPDAPAARPRDPPAVGGRAAALDEDGCFLAGTLVPGPAGPVAIEALRVGDLVLSRDERSGAQGPRRVVRLFRGRTDRVVHVGVAEVGAAPGAAQTLRCTVEHPFHVPGEGWVRAAALRVGDPLVGAAGERLAVVAHEVREEEADHFNVEVEGWHTYFVAGDLNAPAVWVHNRCLDPARGGFKQGIDADEIRALNRQLGGQVELTGAAESALANAARQEGFWNKAASLVRDIAGGHLFNDANKRTAQAVVNELARRNNVLSGVSQSQMRRVIDDVASGKLRDVREIARALRGS